MMALLEVAFLNICDWFRSFVRFQVSALVRNVVVTTLSVFKEPIAALARGVLV